MPSSMLSVQFRNLLPTEELLRFARALWETSQRESGGLMPSADAMLCITKTDSKVAPFQASLQLARGSLESVASSVEPLAAIEAAFSRLRGVAQSRVTPSFSTN